MQFSRHGRWAHLYPGISSTFWQCKDVLPLEQKCSKHWTQQTWMLWALTYLISKSQWTFRIPKNGFTCFVELVLHPLSLQSVLNECIRVRKYNHTNDANRWEKGGGSKPYCSSKGWKLGIYRVENVWHTFFSEEKTLVGNLFPTTLCFLLPLLFVWL